VGGNITPIALANIVAIRPQKHGYESRFFQFVRMGLPFTLVAVGPAACSSGFLRGSRP
jgi:Na+/H+ antiporter NhaD/arsenite permease-like protein